MLMNKSQTAEDGLSVQMLGAFSVHRGDLALDETLNKSRNLGVMMEYLLAQRGRPVPVEELMEVLWEDKDWDNPVKVIQNLIYRLRQLLDVKGRPSHISNLHGGYCWNTSSKYYLDIEDFENFAEEGLKLKRNKQDGKVALTRAVELYRDDFLEDKVFEPWTVTVRQNLKNKYSLCVRELLDILEKEGNYNDIISLCTTAIAIDPYDEKVHVAYINALIKTDRTAHACRHYNLTTDFLQKMLGVSPSKELNEVYNKIKDNISIRQYDIDAIMEESESEKTRAEGPLFCDLETFNKLYDLELRRMQRNGQSNSLVLMTLSNPDYSPPSGEVLKRARSTMNSELIKSLRRGDVVCFRTDSQAIIFLSSITFESAHNVAERIIESFRKSFNNQDILLQYKVRLVEAKF
ncbi:MAG: BTAD domain-containing putative transcriptional regulator [Bacillota bacterium]|nr:BTAD domain-containing putative transcriptional regulator [Bacillota bacterium]